MARLSAFAAFCAVNLAIAHPLVSRQSAVPIGQPITSCTQPGVVALTFDDGPFQYTSELLDILARNGQRATFFVNGWNRGSIEPYLPLVQRMVREGHQVGSHANNHTNLAEAHRTEIPSQMTRLEKLLLGPLGASPTYMRAPFLAYDDDVLDVMRELGYHVIDRDIETDDWRVGGEQGGTVEQSVEKFRNALDRGGSIALAHDTLAHTVKQLAQAMIDILKERNLRSVPVGECLGDPAYNWYRAAR